MVLWIAACAVGGFVLGYGSQKLSQQRWRAQKLTVEQDEPLIDVTFHAEVLNVLTAAARTPAMSHLRPRIEHILLNSGYELSGGCQNGKCGPRIWRRRQLPKFVKKPVTLL